MVRVSQEPPAPALAAVLHVVSTMPVSPEGAAKEVRSDQSGIDAVLTLRVAEPSRRP